MDDVARDVIDEFVDKIAATLSRSAELRTVSQTFSQFKTDVERVTFVYEAPGQDHIVQVQENSALAVKSKDRAVSFRNEGNVYFKRKRDVKALVAYNSSVASAPVNSGDSVELAYAYANRSAVLFHMKEHETCLKDIERSLAAGYPAELQYKLFDRKAKSLRAVKRFRQVMGAFQQLDESLKHSNLDDEKRAQYQREITKASAVWTGMAMKGLAMTPSAEQVDDVKRMLSPRLGANANTAFPSLSRRCDVSYSVDAGRFVTAVEDVQAGEVLMVERPYACVLLPELYGSHCHVCLIRCRATVPCDTCTLATYCGETCKKLADSTFHRYECSVLEAVHKSGLGKFGHLALRAITINDVEFYVDFRKHLSTSKQDKRHAGANDQGLYLADNYSAIYSLVGHSSDRKPADLFRRAVGAVFLLRCLQHAGFFKHNQDESLMLFIGGLLLRHLQSFPCNAHEISELQLDKDYVAESLSTEIGAGIYSTLSLFNHSCDPAATRHFYGSACVVRSIKPLRKGMEVSDNYGTVFAVQDRDDRREKLKTQYHFECQCVACNDNWPLYPQIPHEKAALACSACLCALPDSCEACPKCNLAVDLAEKQRRIKLATEKYMFGLKRLLARDVPEAIGSFTKALNLYHGNVLLPWRDVNNCQEGLKQCFSLLGNCHELSSADAE